VINDINFAQVVNGNNTINVASLGEGPLVVFCHGFPGLWYSWRHQMWAVAAAGYRSVALDMRGYGGSSAPDSVTEYTLDKIRSDLMSVLAHFGDRQATFVGMDFGAAAVWSMALAEPESVRNLVVLGVPYDHDYYGYFGLSGEGISAIPPSQRFAGSAENGFLHAHYFQEPGVAEKELNAQPREILTRLFWALSAKGDLPSAFSRGRAGMGYIEVLGPPGDAIPWSWMSSGDLDYYTDWFQHVGFTGPLNWYRACDLNWQANREYIGQMIEQPCLFVAGAEDPVITMSPPSAIDFMKKMVPNLAEPVFLKGAGHFVQLEQAGLVNRAILQFLDGVQG